MEGGGAIERDPGSGLTRNPDLLAFGPDAPSPAPGPAELRAFGIGLALVLAFWAWLRARHGHAALPWLGAAAAAAALGAARPAALRRVYGPWMRVAVLLARANLWLLSAFLYYGVFTPYALVLRALRKDLLDARLRTGDSYWTKREPARDPDRYLRQY